MKIFLSTVIFFILFSVPGFGQQSKSVLFIGNSYTASNNLPLLISQMANSTGDNLRYSSQTPGGAQFTQHATNPFVISEISSRKWDHVVLQEQSQKPSFAPSYVASNVFPFAKLLCDTIRYFDSCTQPIFFMTWGRKNGDAGNCPSAPWLCTYHGMDSALAMSYKTMANQNDAFVAPVGAAWNYIRINHPLIDLYSSDNSHPSIEGSFAAAATFYTVFFRKDPTLISFNSTLAPGDAQTIKQAVKSVVYDSLSKWKIGEFDPLADFGYNNFGPSIVFSDSSLLASSYTWSFGDGNSSTQQNPTHTYSASGVYSVQLVVTNCGLRDSIRKSIVVNVPSGVKENKNPSILIYPNPSKNGILTIKTQVSSVLNVYTMQNKLVGTFTIQPGVNKLESHTFSSGLYYLQFNTGKIIKWIVE